MATHRIESFAGCVQALKQPGLRQALYDEAAVLMARVLVNLHGAEHRARRNQEATVFRKDVFLHYEKAVLPTTLEETLRPFREAGEGDLVDIGYRILLNLTIDFTGIDRPERSAEETGHLLALMREFSLAPALGQSRLEDIAPLKARIAAAVQVFDAGYFAHSLERRRALKADTEAGRLERSALPNDVLMALVLAEPGLGMSRDELLKEAVFYVLAGAHTSIHSLTHALHELFVWLEAHPDDKMRLRDDPFFIQQCVFESLRLHPSSPVAKRRALCPMVLEDGALENAAAETDDEVFVDLRAANRNPALFGADADLFNPHRAVPPGQFPYGLSMGYGMHACLGRNLAVGVVAKADSVAAEHQYGTVPLIVEALLRCGVQPDPARPPRKDETVTRITWASYPVVFRPKAALL